MFGEKSSNFVQETQPSFGIRIIAKKNSRFFATGSKALLYACVEKYLSFAKILFST